MPSELWLCRFHSASHMNSSYRNILSVPYILDFLLLLQAKGLRFSSVPVYPKYWQGQLDSAILL